MKHSLKPLLRSLSLIVTIGLFLSFSYVRAQDDALAQVIGQTIAAHLQNEGHATRNGTQLLGVTVEGNVVTLNFSAGLFEKGSAASEVAFREMMNAVIGAEGFTLTDAQFVIMVGGVRLDNIFSQMDPVLPPIEQQSGGPLLTIPMPDAPDESGLAPRGGPLSGRKIAISPGHGWTWTGSGWTLQRGWWWGINEALVNAQIVMQLNTLLVNAGATVYPARNMNTNAGNGVSGYPRWEENSREYVRSLGLPSSIWDSSTTDENDDIRVRPLYANYRGADILISVHNNGACNNNCGWKGGTMIIYDTGNGYHNGSYNLAKKIENQLIGSLRSYNSNWWNRGVFGYNGSYGENRIATRPAIIIEAAFMDQEYPDNTFLRDANFRYKIAHGIYKGILDYYGVSDVQIPAETNLITNGTFNSNINGWSTWGEIDIAIYNGVLHFKRRSSSPNGAALHQTANYPSNSGSKFEAKLLIGNSSHVTKTLGVAIHPADDWSNSIECTFTLPPRMPLQTYIVRGISGKAWPSARLELHVGPADSIPDVKVDNVELRYRPGLSISGKQCISPSFSVGQNAGSAFDPANSAAWKTQFEREFARLYQPGAVPITDASTGIQRFRDSGGNTFMLIANPAHRRVYYVGYGMYNWMLKNGFQFEYLISASTKWYNNNIQGLPTSADTWIQDNSFAVCFANGCLRMPNNGTFAIGWMRRLVTNQSFEIAGGNATVANAWQAKNLTNDMRACAKPGNVKFAFDGLCAFAFTGGTSANSAITKVVNTPNVRAGDKLFLNAWVRAVNLTRGGKIAVKLNYTNGTSSNLVTDIPTGQYAYRQLYIPLATTADVASAQITIRMQGGTGKFWVDSVNLFHIPIGSALNSIPGGLGSDGSIVPALDSNATSGSSDGATIPLPLPPESN